MAQRQRTRLARDSVISFGHSGMRVLVSRSRRLSLPPLTADPLRGVGDAIASMERALWQAASDGRMDDFRSLLSDGYHAVYARALVGADEDVAGTSGMETRSFRHETLRVREVAPGIARSMYVTVLDASISGRDHSGDYHGASA